MACKCAFCTAVSFRRGVGMADKLASDTSEEIHAGSSPVPCTKFQIRPLGLVWNFFISIRDGT